MINEKQIHTIATAHLDTVWNWDFEHVISVCLKNTLEENFALFEKYPDYKFNFEGSYRYELFEEYYPAEFEKLKGYIAAGKWNVCGSSYENGDVNMPSPESLFRNILYGNNYFLKKFGKKCNDIFLPDCFGFGWALPAIMQHAHLTGFSTQKLSWGSAYGCPFDIGIWTGSNGKSVFASLDSKSYCTVFKDVRKNSALVKKLDKNIKEYSLPLTFSYHGVGDVGGAPKEDSVRTVCNEIAENDQSDIKVLSTTPCQFFDMLSQMDPSVINNLPRWNNELVMTDHGVGSYTSRAFSKRCNKRNEELADMAERSCIIASDICAYPYPRESLEKAWKKTIAHTFHDDITGTSVERVYKRSWNDYIISANMFSSIYEGANREIIRNIDTSWTKGFAVVVCNSLEQARTSVVDIKIPSVGYNYIRVFDKSGREVPSQVNSVENGYINASICTNVKGFGYKVLDLLYSYEPCTINTGLRAANNIIENFKYIVKVNNRGDICSVVDKTLGRKELLAKPIRYELNKYKGAKEYPAWELTYDEIMKYPWEFAEKGVCTLVENGPVRVTLKVVQKVNKSTFTYYVSLTSGGQWVSVYNEIEWREFCRVLHNGFYLNVRNDRAVFDLGLGTITRKKADKKLYSVPAQKWADISNRDNSCGVAVFSDSKYGWIMKDEHTLKMTVIHSPKNYFRDDSVQGMLDFGLNRYGYAIYSHNGDYRNGVQQNARAYTQPMTAFITDNHSGPIESDFSFGGISNPDVIIRAVKKAESSDEIIVRVNEGANKPATDVELSLGKGIVSAREVYADEEDIGIAKVENGKLIFDIAPNDVKTFAITLVPGRLSAMGEQRYCELEYNADILTSNDERGKTAIPSLNVSIPYEIYPEEIECSGIRFKTGKSSDGMNAVIANGQKVRTEGNKFYFIAASLYGDKAYNFDLDTEKTGIHIQSVNERIGGWDLYDLAETAFIKTDKLAWEATHTHSANKDNVACELYFFMYEINTENTDELTFPDDNGLLILAATEVFDSRTVRLNSNLVESVEKRPFDYKMSRKEKKQHKKLKRRSKKTPNVT